MSRSITDLSPVMQEYAQKFLDTCNSDPIFTSVGAKVFLTQTFRSITEQNADYAQGRSTSGHIITNARAGQSPHNCTQSDGTAFSEAFDIGVETSDGKCDWNASDALWQRAIQIGRDMGLTCGADFCSIKDSPHFQNPLWNVKTNNV